MRMYPAYSLQDVLNMFAVTFLALLNEGYRLQQSYYLNMAYIARSANAEKEDFNKFIRELEWSSKSPLDILNTSGKGDSPADIRKALGG